MRIIIVGDNRERFCSPVTYCIYSLIKEHDVIYQAYDDYGIEYIDSDEIQNQKPDLILCVDDGSFQKIYHSKKSKNIPKAIWISDTHQCDKSWINMRIEMAKHFDHVFVCQKDAVDIFRYALKHDRIGWLPHALYERDFHYQYIEKICDVGAVSYMNSKREVLYPKLKEKFNFVNKNSIWGLQATKFINQCKIGFNLTLSNDIINMRTMETLGCKVPLLQNRCDINTDNNDNGLFDLFQDGVDLFTFANYEEAIEKVDWILNHYDEAMKVAINGWAKVLDRHTYTNRLRTIIKIMEAYAK